MGLFSKWRDRYIKEPIAEQAAALIDKGQYNLAIRALEQGLDIDPDYPSFLWLRADVAVKTGDLAGAVTCYEELEDVWGEESPAALYEAKAQVFFQQKKFSSVILALQQAEEKGIDHIDLFFNRGLANMYIQDYEAALKDFLIVEKSNPDFPDLGPVLAETYYFLKKYRTSTAYFRSLAQKQDLTENQFDMLAYAYLEMKAYKKASIIYGTLIRKFPGNAAYYNNRGYCYTYLNEAKLAISDLNSSLELDPEFAFAYNNRGYAKLLLNQLEEAKADIDHSLELDASNAWVYRNLAFYFIEKKEPETALRQLEKAFVINGEVPLLYYAKGLALLQMGEKKEAMRAFRIAGSRGDALAKAKLKELNLENRA